MADILGTLSSAMYGTRHADMDDLMSTLQLANRFEVRMQNPQGLQLFDTKKDSFRIKDFNIPSTKIETETRNYNGTFHNVPKSKTYDTINVTFYEEQMNQLRRKFFAWQEYIFSKKTGKIQFYRNYTSSFQLKVFGTENTESYGSIYFYEIFPDNIDDITYDRDETGKVMTFKVSFSFAEMSFMDPKITKTPSLDLIGEGKKLISKLF